MKDVVFLLVLMLILTYRCATDVRLGKLGGAIYFLTVIAGSCACSYLISEAVR